MKIEPINTGILGVNTWIVNFAENAVFIVDPACCKLSGDDKVIFDYLKKNGKVAVGVFLTHGHFDHLMGLKTLKEKFPKLNISIHKNDAECVGSNSRFAQNKILSHLGAGINSLLDEVSNLPEADVFLEDGMSFDKIISLKNIKDAFEEQVENCQSLNSTKLNSSESQNLDCKNINYDEVINALSQWSVIYTPGHSKGSVCFYNKKEKVLISGDTIFCGTYGRTDLYGGDENEIKKSISHLMNSLPKDTKVYPGHDTYGFTLGCAL